MFIPAPKTTATDLFSSLAQSGDSDSGRPQRMLYRPLLVLAAMALSVGCGVDIDDPLVAPPRTLEQVQNNLPCSGLCFDDPEQAALTQTQAELESCTPEAEASFDDDPEGLIISDIALGAVRDDGAVELLVVVGRTASQGHYAYPGTRVVVDAGGGIARQLDAAAYEATAEEWAYGIEGCGEFVHGYWIKPDAAGEMVLTASVTADLGEHDIAEVSFRYVP